jgi:hypothetical protein
MQDRDRIVADPQNKVIQQVFAAGMSLHSAAGLVTQPEVRRRILASADSLDQVLRQTRDAVFGLKHHLQGRGLRVEIVALCEEMSPVPEVSFTGPGRRRARPGVLPAGAAAPGLRALPGLAGQALPGRAKTDKLDSAWLAKVTERGRWPGRSCRRRTSAACVPIPATAGS